MSKQLKSIRLDEGLLNLYDEYSGLLNEMFGISISLSQFINEAFAEYFSERSASYHSIMKSQSVIKTLPNGKIEKYVFSKKQLDSMKKIATEAEHINLSLQYPSNNSSDNSKNKYPKSNMTLLEYANLSMNDDRETLILSISKEAAEHLRFLEREFSCFSFDEVVNLLIHYASFTENMENIAEAINLPI